MLAIVCLKEIYILLPLKKLFLIAQQMVDKFLFNINKGLGYEVSYPKYRWHKKKSLI